MSTQMSHPTDRRHQGDFRDGYRLMSIHQLSIRQNIRPRGFRYELNIHLKHIRQTRFQHRLSIHLIEVHHQTEVRHRLSIRLKHIHLSEVRRQTTVRRQQNNRNRHFCCSDVLLRAIHRHNHNRLCQHAQEERCHRVGYLDLGHLSNRKKRRQQEQVQSNLRLRLRVNHSHIHRHRLKTNVLACVPANHRQQRHIRHHMKKLQELPLRVRHHIRMKPLELVRHHNHMKLQELPLLVRLRIHMKKLQELQLLERRRYLVNHHRCEHHSEDHHRHCKANRQIWPTIRQKFDPD